MSDESIVILCCIGITLCIHIGMYGAICETVRRYAFDILREIRMAERELLVKNRGMTQPTSQPEKWELVITDQQDASDA